MCWIHYCCALPTLHSSQTFNVQRTLDSTFSYCKLYTHDNQCVAYTLLCFTYLFFSNLQCTVYTTVRYLIVHSTLFSNLQCAAYTTVRYLITQYTLSKPSMCRIHYCCALSNCTQYTRVKPSMCSIHYCTLSNVHSTLFLNLQCAEYTTAVRYLIVPSTPVLNLQCAAYTTVHYLMYTVHSF